MGRVIDLLTEGGEIEGPQSVPGDPNRERRQRILGGSKTQRGQAHTLEAVVAGIVLLSSLVFALQVTAVTPLSASTASQHIENQQQSVATGVLAVTQETGALKRAVLFWNTTGFKFHNATNNYYVNNVPPNDFGDILKRAYRGQGIAYNVYVSYEDGQGNQERRRMLYRGEPSDHAVTSARTVTLYENDELYDAKEMESGTTLDSTSDFYAPNASSSTGLYNTVRVEVVVWRM